MTLKSDRQLKRFYNTYNRLYFDGKLPECHIWWEPLGGSTFGDCLYLEEEKVWRIRMNPFMAGWKSVYRFTLLHEMVHVKLSPYLKHGKKFNDEMLRLAEQGAFNNIW
jgi:hypothetical protein